MTSGDKIHYLTLHSRLQAKCLQVPNTTIIRICLFISVFCTLLNSQEAFCQDDKPVNNYPKVQGYFAIFHPIAGYNAPTNFQDNYVVGFPIGINVFKNEKIGYSFEQFPFIQANNEGSKISKIVFHPGAIFKLNHGFALTGRLAFESTGRYGLTQVLTKTIKKTRTGGFSVSLVIAERFGNEMSTSVSYGIGLGLSF